MSTGASIRQSLLVGLAGCALIMSAVSWTHRQEAAAVPPLPRVDDLSTAFRTVAADATPSIVSIETVTKAKQVHNRGQQRFPDDAIPAPLREFFRNEPRMDDHMRNPGRPGPAPQRRGMGSGFIIDSNGIILTNNHVVNGADEVKVKLHDGREFIGHDIKTDPRTDVAIVRIDATGLKALRLGDSHATQVGDWVLAIGSPFGLEMTVTSGIISAKGRSNQITQRADFLQTDAAINPGNSGGPLINMRGEVIGINTAIATESGGYDGIGFAIPSHIAGWVSQKLIASGEVQRGYLGTEIKAVDAQTAKQFNVKVREGALVVSVLPGSPADKAGMEPGDLIVKLNDQTINDPTSLQGAVEQLAIGKTYSLEVNRHGKKQTLEVTLAEMPKTFTVSSRHDDEAQTPASPKSDSLGLQLSPLTHDLAKQFGIRGDSGLVITGVEEGSPAQTAGLKSGDVIEKAGGQAVSTVQEYDQARDQFSKGDGLVLNIRSSDGKRFFVILKAE